MGIEENLSNFVFSLFLREIFLAPRSLKNDQKISLLLSDIVLSDKVLGYYIGQSLPIITLKKMAVYG